MVHMAENMKKTTRECPTSKTNDSPTNANAPFLSSHLSKACGIPPHYLYKILSKLVHAGILIAHPGKKGGYNLQKDPNDLTLYEIIEPFENFSNYSNCFCGQHPCLLYGKNPSYKQCPLHPIIKDNVIQMFAKFKSITLQSLLNTYLSNTSPSTICNL